MVSRLPVSECTGGQERQEKKAEPTHENDVKREEYTNMRSRKAKKEGNDGAGRDE